MPGRVATPEVLQRAAMLAAVELDDRGRRVVEIARRLAPVLYGDLRSSIGHDVRLVDDRPVLVISVAVPYARVAEFGFGNRPAHPYVRPALAEVFGHGLAAAAPLIQLGGHAPAAH